MTKANVGELEDEARKVFYRRLRKYFTNEVQLLSGKKGLLVRFQYGCEKDMTSNQLTAVTIEKSP